MDPGHDGAQALDPVFIRGLVPEPVAVRHLPFANRLRDDHRKNVNKRKALARLATRAEIEHHDPEIDEFDRLLATPPRQQRAAAALFYVDGLSVAEIATTLGIAEGSVKSHLYDARQRLRPLLTHPTQDPS